LLPFLLAFYSMAHEIKPNPNMLLTRFMTPDTKKTLTGVKTACGFTLEDCCRSGVANPDSSIGVYAGDQDCYEKFALLFDPIIQAYHGFPKDGKHKRNLNTADLGNLPDLDPTGRSINSTRIRVARNLKDFGFTPAVSREARKEIERRVVEALNTLEGDLAGKYYPLQGMAPDVQKQMIMDHFLFKEGDRFLEAAGCNRDWPEGRGIFHSADKRFLVWVNEEDELRIISMQNGGNIKEVFDRLSRAITALEKKIAFAFTDHHGYLTSCPSNLGTAMRASVHVKLPKLSKTADFKKICEDIKLSVRGVHGEHSESEGGVFDISNKQRLGVDEVECTKLLYAGVKRLLELESKL